MPRGIAVANSAPHSQQQTFTELFPPREGWFNHENGGLSLTYMGLSTEQEILVPSYLAKWRFTSRLTGLYGRYIYS
jgi:hypothetical protein